jgi:hypothetical protein
MREPVESQKNIFCARAVDTGGWEYVGKKYVPYF